ncbi:hypothetical protein AB1Y20_001648 [Prymnesium parvum]|uniref:TraB domain-containing protein n=1 Tax=Prymnesium parvum TaxID=97485 RepID=A0AB34KA18_PRYPA
MLLLLLTPCALQLPPPPLTRREALRTALAGAALPFCAPSHRASASPCPAASPLCRAAAASPLCDPAVSLLRDGERRIALVGTAHISADSADLVRRVIRYTRPDAVMLELDAARASRLLPRAAAPPPPPPPPPRGVAARVLRGEAGELSAEAIGEGLASLYRSLDSLGFQSGSEFVAAAEEAERVGAAVVLGDRDVRVTLRRLRDALGELLASGALTRELPPPPLFAEQGLLEESEMTYENVKRSIEVLKERENVRALTGYMRAEANPLYEALIGERDAYMARTLLNAQGRTIVAVVGLAHMDGIESYFTKDTSLACSL